MDDCGIDLEVEPIPLSVAHSRENCYLFQLKPLSLKGVMGKVLREPGVGGAERKGSAICS